MPTRLIGEEAVYWVYILASKPYGTLYIGVTSELTNRIAKHRSGSPPGFTSRHKVFKLVYFEAFGEIGAAIQREKTMKKWKRDWKINLIERDNPHWTDLYPALIGEAESWLLHGLPGQARQ